MSQTANPWGTPEQQNTQDPWGTTPAQQPAQDPWGSNTPTEQAVEPPATTDWLTPSDAPAEKAFSFDTMFDEATIPLEGWVESALTWTVEHFRDFFQSIRVPIDIILGGIENFLQALNPWVIIIFFGLLAWQVANKKLAIGTVISLIFIGLIGAWSEAMITLALVFTSVLFCVLIGIPMGIWI